MDIQKLSKLTVVFLLAVVTVIYQCEQESMMHRDNIVAKHLFRWSKTSCFVAWICAQLLYSYISKRNEPKAADSKQTLKANKRSKQKHAKIPVFGWHEWNRSAVTVHPPQGPVYRVFWYAFLLTMAVQSGCLRSHIFPVSSNVSLLHQQIYCSPNVVYLSPHFRLFYVKIPGDQVSLSLPVKVKVILTLQCFQEAGARALSVSLRVKELFSALYLRSEMYLSYMCLDYILHPYAHCLLWQKANKCLGNLITSPGLYS